MKFCKFIRFILNDFFFTDKNFEIVFTERKFLK